MSTVTAASIERDINFCPLDPPSMERPMLVMNLLYYSRHQNYGAVPEPVFVNGLWLGMVTHNALQFPVNVQRNRACDPLVTRDIGVSSCPGTGNRTSKLVLERAK